MTASKPTNVLEGNLASEPKYRQANSEKQARIVFRVVHNERYFDRQSRQWLDGRKTTVDVSFYGPAADGIAKKMNDHPDIFVKGAKVIAFGEVAEPGAYLSDAVSHAAAWPCLAGESSLTRSPTRNAR